AHARRLREASTDERVLALRAVAAVAFEAGLARPRGEAGIAEAAVGPIRAADEGGALRRRIARHRFAARDCCQKCLSSIDLRLGVGRQSERDRTRSRDPVLAEQMEDRDASRLMAARARELIESTDERLRRTR